MLRQFTKLFPPCGFNIEWGSLVAVGIQKSVPVIQSTGERE